MKINRKFVFISSITLTALIVAGIIFHLLVLPGIIKSKAMINTLSKAIYNSTKYELKIKKPKLKTYIKPQIDFSVEDLTIKKDNEELVDLKNFDISISYNKIFKKEIKLNKLIAKNLTVKADKILSTLELEETQEEAKPLDWKINLFNSNIKLDDLFLSFNQKNNTSFELQSKNMFLDCSNDFKKLNFNTKSKIYNNHKPFVDITVNSSDEIKIYDDNIKIDNLNVLINNSSLTLNGSIDLKNVFINAKSNKFNLDDIFKIINSNFVIPDGSQLLSPLNNPNGFISFDINSNNNDLSGCINVNNTKANIKDLTSIPLNIQKGKIEITKDKVIFKDLIGYYGKNKKNSIKIYGDIKDYYKTFDSDIQIDTIITNELFKTYLAPLAQNTVLYVSKPVKTKILYKAINNIMDITWLAKIPKGVEFGMAGDSNSALTPYDRAVKGDFRLIGENLDIKNINYYIASDIRKGVKIKPILVLDGKMKLDGTIDNIGFAFGREMPSEFLNIFTKDKTFKKGTVKGNLHVAFKNNIPVLDADMELNKTIIPSQRMFIKNAKLISDNNFIDILASGRFQRVKFDFKGKIKNELNPPFVIKDMKLDLDNVDVEKFLTSVNNQSQTVDNKNIDSEKDIENSNDDFMFDTNLVRIENSDFSLKTGKYKELNFSDIKAKLTLDKNGLLNIQSNKFNIAEGISTLKVQSDLKNLKHYIRLGVKDVDSNLMAKVLLNLENEISGKAMGLIELNTDKDLKLNGQILFDISNGTIGKIGLVEYVLKIASVFRNPIVVINPTTVMGIITIPEGKFDKIHGEIKLKDNVAHSINIVSSAPTLSALIRGRFDMELHDASIRIYTRFAAGKISVFNFLRNISMNSLANKVQMNSRNDANYYSAELKDLPQIHISNEKSQVFLTTVEGDVEHNNYLSSLKKIK